MMSLNRKTVSLIWRAIGVLLLPGIWWLLKYNKSVSDRYLPSIHSVVYSAFDLNPNIFVHVLWTSARLAVGFMLGVVGGLSIGLLVARFKTANDLTMPLIQSTRSIPGIALVPFFLLWFGFSDVGRYLLVLFGIGFNIAVASAQIIAETPEKYRIMFNTFGAVPTSFPLSYMLPYATEHLLPTLRFSLSTAIGLVVTSELLGSQVGLGYLIQTSLNTFSLHVVFLVAIILGVINVLLDWLLQMAWRHLVFWTKT